MVHVEQTIFSFKERMKATFYFSTAPLSLLISLFAVSGKGEYGDIVRGISIFFGVISAPVLLLAAPVMITLGIIAGLAQAAFFPFQLLLSAIKDVTPPSVPESEHKSESTNDAPLYNANSSDVGVYKHAEKHFQPLFSSNKISTESQAQELTPEDNYLTP